VDPTKVLSDEHRVIETVLTCIDTMARQAHATHVLDPDTADMALRFVVAYADRWHHQKEEGCLFPMLEQRGLPPHEGPVAVMLQEHELGRGHVKAMREAVAKVRAGESAAAMAFAVDAQAYVALLRDHIAKEDSCLWPMALEVLSSHDRAKLLQDYERAEAEIPEAESGKAMVALAAEIAKRCGIPA